LKKAPKTQSLDHWLREWEKVYTDCKLLDLPDVSRNRSLFDFLNAIASISPGFSDAWMMRIQEKQDAGETLPDLYKMVELFRNNRRLVNAQKRPTLSQRLCSHLPRQNVRFRQHENGRKTYSQKALSLWR